MSPLARWRLRHGRGQLSCRQIARVLQHYLDDMTDPAVAYRVSQHLDACRDCGLEADVYRAIKASLSRQGIPPDDARSRLEAFARELAERRPIDD